MRAIWRLLRRLNSVFNKEPEPKPLLRVASPDDAVTTAEVADNILTFRPGANYTCGPHTTNPLLTCGRREESAAFVLGDKTLAAVAAEVDATGGFAAQLLDASFAPRLARAVLERAQELLADNPDLSYPQALLWAEMQTYAWALDEQADRVALVEDQMYPTRAGAEWLDHWGKNWFGIPRETAETDGEYGPRFLWETMRPRCNNRALEIILENALGVKATVSDAYVFAGKSLLDFKYGSGWKYGTPGLVYGGHPTIPGVPEDLYGYFLVELAVDSTLAPEVVETLIARGKAIANRYKAAGTKILDNISLVERLEDLLYVRDLSRIEEAEDEGGEALGGPTQYGGAWVYGAPRLKYGTIDGVAEQIRSTVLDATDDSVLSDEYV